VYYDHECPVIWPRPLPNLQKEQEELSKELIQIDEEEEGEAEKEQESIEKWFKQRMSVGNPIERIQTSSSDSVLDC